jgi:hypothetical protein
MSNPKVFISYSHDSPEHAQCVLDLSNRLREWGVDCIIDQYEPFPPEGWPHWMEQPNSPKTKINTQPTH